MNKTVTVNIGGIVFHIDENAYERFKKYLESIRVHFSGSEGRDEIMEDIESRIAEMFHDRIRDQKQVITLADVDEVTALMGMPEQIGDEEKKIYEPVVSPTSTIKRRMFRNPDDKILGGVCSGVAAYFNMDPVWTRLILAFAFFAWGTGFLLYIILWIVLPKAITTADKLQMRGEPVTIENIQKNVHDELGQIKKNLSDQESKPITRTISKFFEAIVQLIKMIFTIIGKIIAVFFILLGMLMVFAVFVSLLAILKVPGTQYPEVLNQIFPSGFHFSFALIATALVVGIPFIVLGYFGARVLLNIKKSSRIFNLSAFGVWISALLVCIVLGVSVAKDFSEKQSLRKEISLLQPQGGVVVLKALKADENQKQYDNWDEDEWNGDLRLSMSDNQLQSKDVKLDIVPAISDSFSLSQICYARGSSKKIAADHASHISYSFNQIDSTITFNRYFAIEKGEKYRSQKVQLVLHMPVGSRIYLDKSLHRLIYDIDNIENVLDADMLNRTWEMTKEGLKCIDCTGQESKIGDIDVKHKISNGSRVHISDKGVYIKGDNDEEVAIDSNGVIIRKNGKIKVYKGGNVDIKIGDEW